MKKSALPVIRVVEHRGVKKFKWKDPNTKTWRRIIVSNPESPKAIKEQHDEILAKILTNPGPAKKKIRTLQQNLEVFELDLNSKSKGNHATQTCNRIKRIFAAANITRSGQITLATTRTAIDSLSCQPRHKKKDVPKVQRSLSEHSINHYKRAIKQFCRWLEIEGQIEQSPLRHLKISTKVVPKKARDRLQPSELKALVTYARNSDVEIEGVDGMTRASAYTISASTGLRRGEIAKLTRDCFDWDNRVVILEAGYTKDKKKAVQPLPKELIEKLRPWVESRSGYLFPDFNVRKTDKMIRKDMTAAGLPIKTVTGFRTFHSLRNTYISSLFDLGLNLARVQRLARHSDPRLTMNYAKPSSDDAEAVDVLPCPWE